MRHVLALAVALEASWVPGTGLAQTSVGSPYVLADSAWGDLPEGRAWGAISAIHPGVGGRSIWVADRCGSNGCVGRETVDMIFGVAVDALGNVYGGEVGPRTVRKYVRH